MLIPYQGPSSDYVVVKMIPDSRLPPRHLHAVHIGKTSALIKWESPYDSPDQDLVSQLDVCACVRACSQAAVPILGLLWNGERGGKGLIL